MRGPLAGIHVLEVANWIAVPAAAALMADMGASVIKVEPLAGDTWRYFTDIPSEEFDYDFSTSYPFQMDNRGKSSVALDLGKAEATEVVGALVEKADVFMTNLVPGRLERFQLRYEDLLPRNPRLIYLAFNGYGPEGPDKDRLGFDISAFWAWSGMMSQFRSPGQIPVILPSGFGDHTTAPLLLSGVLAALWERQRTGKGQKITGSLLNSALWVLGADIAYTLVARREPKLYHRKDRPTLLYNVHRTRDDRWLIVVMDDSDENWAKLCSAVKRDDLSTDPRNGTREQRTSRISELRMELDRAIGSMTLEELWPRLDANGMVWAPMKSLAEIIEDPQVKANQFLTQLEHPNYGVFETIDTPLKFSGSEVGARGPAPELGQHTEEVLRDLGYTWDKITQLKDIGAIP